MAEPSNRNPRLSLLAFTFGLATVVTITLASAEVRAFWLILCGLAIGAAALEIVGGELECYLSSEAEPGALSDRVRLASVMGVVFGAVFMIAIIVSDALDGAAVLFFIVALLTGRYAASALHRSWKQWTPGESEPEEGDEDPESQADRASRMAAGTDTTGKQLVNGLWLVLGFALGAGLALGCAVFVRALGG